MAGAISAPIGGRAADRGWGLPATLAAMLLAARAFGLTMLAETGAHASRGLLVLAAVVLDFGVQINVVVGSRALFMLYPAHRSRLNGLYMAAFFSAGAVGSTLGVWGLRAGRLATRLRDRRCRAPAWAGQRRHREKVLGARQV